jgi:hypothetical protein
MAAAPLATANGVNKFRAGHQAFQGNVNAPGSAPFFPPARRQSVDPTCRRPHLGAFAATNTGIPFTIEGTTMKATSMIRLGLIALLACSAFMGANAMAQDTSVPGHSRVNEVNNRVDNQQNRTANGIAQGTITGKQAANNEKRDTNIAQRESADEAKHNGHLTKAEDRHLNRSENRNSRAIHRQRH